MPYISQIDASYAFEPSEGSNDVKETIQNAPSTDSGACFQVQGMDMLVFL